MDDYIGKDTPEFKEFLGQIDRSRKAVETVCASHRPMLGSERYLDGGEVMQYLHISPRTLQTLRDTHTVAFTSIGGKILYPERELNKVLADNYRPASRDF